MLVIGDQSDRGSVIFNMWLSRLPETLTTSQKMKAAGDFYGLGLKVVNGIFIYIILAKTQLYNHNYYKGLRNILCCNSATTLPMVVAGESLGGRSSVFGEELVTPATVRLPTSLFFKLTYSALALPK